MRPELLVLKNFGPFSGEHRADFSALGDFFLICGETGAGKTTLFDAISYAFYGEAPGSRKGLSRQLRSQYAQAADESFVMLTFTIGKRKYRIRRTLPSERESRRTNRTVQIPEEVSLEEWTENRWESVPGNKSETDRKILSLIKLSADEFAKIVLLPQGEFSRFLRQNSEERKEILAKLFPVSVYRETAEAVKEKAKEAETKATAYRLQLQEIARDFREETYPDEKKRLEETAAACGRRARQLAEQQEENRLRTDKAARIRTLTGNLRQAEQEYASEVENRAGDCETWKRKLADGERAEPVAALLRERARMAEDLAEIRRQREEQDAARKQAQAEAERLAEEKEKTGGWREKTEELTRQAAVLEEAEKAAAEAAAHDDALQTLEKQWKAAQALFRRTAEELASVSQEIAAGGAGNTEQAVFAQSQKKAEAENRVRAIREKAARTREYLEEKENRGNKKQEMDAAARYVEEAESIRKSAEENWQAAAARTKAEETASMAAILARDLTEGTPCPVCGSVHHPGSAPGKQSGDRLPHCKQEEANAQRAREQAETELQKAKETLARLRGEYESLAARTEKTEAAGGIFTSAEEAELAAAQAQKEAQQAAGDFQAAEQAWKRMQSLREKRDELQQTAAAQENDARQKEQILALRRADKERALKRFSEILPDKDADPKEAARARAACEEEKQRLNRLLAEFQNAYEQNAAEISRLEGAAKMLAASCSNLEQNLAGTEESLQKLCAAAGFRNPAEAEQAVLDAEEKKSLERQKSEFEKRKSALEAELALLQEKLREESAGEPPASETDLQNERRILEEAVRENQNEREQAVIQLDALEKKYARWLAAKADYAGQENERGILSSLSADLQGKNPRNMKFESWILQRYLEEIVAYANARISRMSDDRYRLQTGSAFRKGSAMTGLDLEIFDSFTGQPRPAATLSGGETFIVSISLALGLADSIQSRAGGIQLEAVFIDEGFGTLDESFLELAMNIFDEIRGHRMVGIISHIKELEDRIPEKLEVRKKPSGGSWIARKSLEEKENCRRQA